MSQQPHWSLYVPHAHCFGGQTSGLHVTAAQFGGDVAEELAMTTATNRSATKTAFIVNRGYESVLFRGSAVSASAPAAKM